MPREPRVSGNCRQTSGRAKLASVIEVIGDLHPYCSRILVPKPNDLPKLAYLCVHGCWHYTTTISGDCPFADQHVFVRAIPNQKKAGKAESRR